MFKNKNLRMSKTKSKLHSGGKLKTLEIKKFFFLSTEFKVNIKLFHFQTKYYNSHKSSDELYTQFEIHYDNLFEIIQSIFGKFKNISGEIKVKPLTDKNIVKYCEKYIEKTHKYCHQICSSKGKHNKYTEVHSIVDEMVSVIRKFIYLQQFK